MNVTPVCLSKDRHPSFIGGYMLSDPTVCDELIDFIDSSTAILSGETYQGVVADRDGKPIVNKAFKDCTQRNLFWNDSAGMSYSAELQKCLDAYLEEFKAANDVPVFNIGPRPLLVQKYPKGGAYHSWHSERSTLVHLTRHLAFMTYLNDVSDGGETEFLYQKLKIRPRKGLTLIWPTDWTHMHRGIPSPTQEKYIVTGWYCFA